MITRQSCRRCGHPFRRELAQGLCPRCLLTAGLRYARELPPSAGFRRVDPRQPIGPESNTGQPWRSAQGAAPGEPQATESVDRAPGRTGDYELLEELGRGGMGIVYRARQLSLNRVVALKILRADGFHSEAARRRFRVEAQTVAELNHPHIVSIFDTAEIEGRPCFAMEWVRGRPPFQADTVTETLRQLAAQDPVAPRLLNPAIPRDLETVCLKCLDKEPHRRYQSALEVAEELARFLCGEPIRARPLRPTARLWRWSRRKPVLASLLTGITTLALVILIGAPLALMRIHRAQGRAELAAAHTARLLYVSDMNIAFQALRENRLGRVRELLERHRPQPGEEDLRSWEWGHLWHESRPHELLTLPGDNHDVRSIAYSPDGNWLAVAKYDGNAEIWDLTTRQVIVRLTHDAPVWDLAFTSDRRYLVAVTRTFPEVAHRLRIYEVSTWRELASVSLAYAP